ncbi:MAG: septal ring lytic transglycosylase RlpA family protein [Methyloceanibacter sp.]
MVANLGALLGVLASFFVGQIAEGFVNPPDVTIESSHPISSPDEAKLREGLEPVRLPPEKPTWPEIDPETGEASWYSLPTPTASGELMDPEALTAAHPSIPLGTKVVVENLDNGEHVIVRINDRGPFAGDRIIDLRRLPPKRSTCSPTARRKSASRALRRLIRWA